MRAVHRVLVLTFTFLLAEGILSQVSAQTPVLPIDYRVGPLQRDAHVNYAGYPYTLGSIADITDSSLETYTHLRGLDRDTSGVPADTGTFYLLQYQIDPEALAFRIDFTARIENTRTSRFDEFLVIGLRAGDGLPGPTMKWAEASEITTFGLEISRNGNTGNDPQAVNWGLDSMLDAQGRFRIVLQGGFIAGLDEPGSIQTYLYEVRALSIPEPRTVPLLSMVAIIVVLRYRKAFRGKRKRLLARAW
jgi:hypothetical protein